VPGTKRSRLTYNILLSNFAFNFNLRRYSEAGLPQPGDHDPDAARPQCKTNLIISPQAICRQW